MPPSVRKRAKNGNQAVAIPDLLKPFIGPDPAFPMRIRWARDHPGITNTPNMTVEAFKRYCDPSDSLSEMIAAVWSFAERKWVPFTVEAFSPPLRPPIVLIPASAHTRPPETETRGPQMLEDGKSFMQDGVRYFPLSAAATAAQAPRSTLLHWIKNGVKFDGHPLQNYYFAPANRYFLSEESIVRAANRFVRWPSQEPAGTVTLGDTDDKSGFVRLTEAARSIGVDHRTMWLWATQGKAPTDEQSDVIKCPATDQFYIRERDVSKLKKLVPRSGLRRGRRPQNTPLPT